MSGLTSKIQLISNALVLLGGTPIASLTDGTTGATLGANLFENTYIALLQNHRWRFAVKTQQLSRLTATPNTDYQYAFAMPNDFKYAVKGSSNMYEVYDSEIHCNDREFKLEYVRRVDEDALPAYFSKALEYELASIFAIPLTGDINKADYYKREFTDAIRKAKFADSTQYPEVAVEHSPYTDVRY